MKISSNEQYIYSFELLFISTTHVVPRAVVQTNNSSNEIAFWDQNKLIFIMPNALVL